MLKALDATKVRHTFVHYKDRGHVGLTDEVLQGARKFINQLDKNVE
jgi:hypothetical protein